jgi:O-antigen/teichoic acid export membrane protein
MTKSAQVNKALIIINSFSFIFTQVLNISVIVWLQRYLLKRISVDEYSIYPIIVSVMMIISLVRTLFNAGVFRYGMAAYAKGDEESLHEVLASSFYLIICVASIIWLLGMVFSWNINHVLKISDGLIWDARIMMALLLTNFAFDMASAPLFMGLNLKQKYYVINTVNSSVEILRLALLFLLLFLVSTRVLWIVVATVISHIIGTLVKVYLSKREIPSLKIRRKNFRWSTAKEMMGFGGWNFLLMLALSIRNSSDVVILNRLATPFDVTCFHLGRLFHKYSVMTWETARLSLFPVLTAMHSLEMETGLRNAYMRGGRYALWMTLFLATPVIAFREELLVIYVGQEFLLAATVALLLLLTIPLEYGNAMLRLIARASASMKALAIFTVIAQLVNITVTIYFVGSLKMGAAGSAFSTFFTFLILEPILVWPIGLTMVKMKLATFAKETLIPGLVPFSVSLLFYYIIKMFFSVNSLSNIILGSFLGSLIYLLALIISLRPKDRTDIGLAYKKIKSVFLNRGIQ